MEKILLIGENIPFLKSIADEFEKLGFKAFTAGEEEDGMKFITMEVPDVMLLTYGIKRFNPLKLVFKLREVNLLAKLVYLHPESIKPSPPDESFYIFVSDALPPDLIVTKVVEAIDNANPIGEMTIKDVLWILNFEKRSAFVRIFTDEAEGEVIVIDGKPVSCKLGIYVGDEAFSSIVNLETIAYEISWEVPQNVEKNVKMGVEDFLGKPFAEERKEQESGIKDFENITKELERDIEELTTVEPKEFTLNEFTPFEKEDTGETWELKDVGEDVESEIRGEEKQESSQENLSSILDDEDIFIKSEEESSSETLRLEEESEFPSEFEFPEEITFEEEIKEEKAPEEVSELGELGGLSEEQGKSQPFEDQSFVPTEELLEPSSDIQGEVDTTAQKYERTLPLKVDETIRMKLASRVITGLVSMMIVRANEIIYVSSEKDIGELKEFHKESIDEGYFRIQKDIYVLIKTGEVSLIAKWRNVVPGYALYMAKRLIKEIQV